MLTWRKWQNSKHSSRSPWVQVLKDLMKNMEGRCQVPDLSSQKANLDEFDPGAETEPLGGMVMMLLMHQIFPVMVSQMGLWVKLNIYQSMMVLHLELPILT